jgi:intracellular multiplication protein IcmT
MEIQDQPHWRDVARTPRFFFVDALAAIPLVIWLLHMRWWTFILALCLIAFFMILERFRFTVPVFFRWLRATLAGPIKISYPWWRT